jgi:putative cardiolipin synthase
VGPVVAQVTLGFEAFWSSAWTRPAESLASADPDTDLSGLMQAATDQVTALGYLPPADLAGRFQAETLPALVWAPARVVFDPPPTPEQVAGSDEAQLVARELRRLVATARNEILAESAYLILVGDSLEEAARLRASGVRMRALTNSLASNDLVTNHSGYARNRAAMLEAGIELYELRPDAAACQRLIELSRACDERPAFSLHSKSIVVDRRVVYVGSFNLNLRSTYLNSETALIVDSPELGAQVAASMDELLQPDSSWRVLRNSDGSLEWRTEIEGEEVRSTHEPMAGRWKRFTSRFYRLFPLEKYL